MKISEQWLREWVNPENSSQQLAAQLTMAGLEVGAVMPVAKAFDGVVVAYVISVTPHPDAEKLNICQVDYGAEWPVQIVCGAANVKAGIKVPLATMGGHIGADFKIKKAKLRGIESFGMICSASELGLTEETAKGIMILPDDAPLGEDFRIYLSLNDSILDLELTANRGDCLSILGVAREVAVINSLPLRQAEYNELAAGNKVQMKVDIQAESDCMHYVSRVITNINPRVKTPLWMQERLRRCGARSIDPVVDVTNYVMFELGQPLHAYDLNAVKGKVVVRRAKSLEKVLLLDGQEVICDPDTLVIADDNHPLALAGIMGAKDSAVTDKTTDILLESALFSPIIIAGKARQFGLASEASHRFERGVDPQLQARAIHRATELLVDIVGGEPGPVVAKQSSYYRQELLPIFLEQTYIHRLLGKSIAEQTVSKILQGLGMEIIQQSDGWKVIPPTYRYDITIAEDLIEEIARIDGYHHIPSQPPVLTSAAVISGANRQKEQKLGFLLSQLGYQEAITYSFIAPELQRLFTGEEGLQLVNPISEQLSTMRMTLWPGLLNALEYNVSYQQNRIRFYEIGQRFIQVDGELRQQKMLAGLIAGDVSPEQWGIESRSCDFFDLKGDVELILNAICGAQLFTFRTASHPALHPGQQAEVCLNDQVIGYLGALHPAIVQKRQLKHVPLFFEFILEYCDSEKLAKFAIISKLPSVRRDLALIVDEAVSYDQIEDCIRSKAGNLLQKIFPFDFYTGKGVPNGKKSLALGLILQDAEHTLTDEKVNSLMDEIIGMLSVNLNATLRT